MLRKLDYHNTHMKIVFSHYWHSQADTSHIILPEKNRKMLEYALLHEDYWDQLIVHRTQEKNVIRLDPH